MTTDPGVSLKRGSLDRAGIFEAAVALVDREGLHALNMRALARDLGVGTMSLYHHVANKEDLLDGIVETVLGEMEMPQAATAPPEERVTLMARSLRAVGLRHPECIPLLVTRPFQTGPALHPCEIAFGVLAEAGLDAEQALVAFRTVVAYVLGFVMMESAGFFVGVANCGAAELMAMGLPRLAEIAPHLEGRDTERDFDTGLRLVEEGVLGQQAGEAPPVIV